MVCFFPKWEANLDLCGHYYHYHNADYDGDGVGCFGVSDRSNNCAYCLLSGGGYLIPGLVFSESILVSFE